MLCGGRRRSRSLRQSYQNGRMIESLEEREALQSAIELIVRHCGVPGDEEYFQEVTNYGYLNFNSHFCVYVQKERSGFKST